MTRLPIGTTIRVTGYVFKGKTGTILADDWRTDAAPDYQRVELDSGLEYLERIDRLEVVEKKGQRDLFGSAA